MKFIAFNSSPRGVAGHTYMMLDILSKGITKAGSTLEIINLDECNITMCTGCLQCWVNQGNCIYKDDMDLLIEKICNADVMILGSPLYYDQITARMKIFIERLLPLHSARIIKKSKNFYVHEITVKVPKLIMLCSCDLPGNYNFDNVSGYIKKVAKNMDTELIAEIYRSQARLFRWKQDGIQIVIKEYKKKLEKAGYELASELKIDPQNQSYLTAPLLAYELYVNGANEQADLFRQVYPEELD